MFSNGDATLAFPLLAIAEGRYIDGKIIDIIGVYSLESWLETVSYEEANIVSLVSKFDITETQLQSVVRKGRLQAIYDVPRIVSEAAEIDKVNEQIISQSELTGSDIITTQD